MIKYLLAAALLLTPVSATARDVSTNDGNELLGYCQDDAYYSKGVCMGIVMGSINTLDSWALVNKSKPYCRPDNVTWGQIQEVVVSYLTRHPETRHESYSLLILKSQRSAWPCAKDVS